MIMQKLHIIITLIAALIVTIISTYNSDGLYEYAVKVIITVVLFYVFGSIIKGLINRAAPQPVIEENLEIEPAADEVDITDSIEEEYDDYDEDSGQEGGVISE